MRILYIDDDPEDIEIFQEAVKAVDPSIQFHSATGAREAFAFLNEADPLPNHIILDMNMPRMDGKLCLHELRKDKRFANINVIIYSTSCSKKDVDEMESLRATFVTKANSFNDICQMIHGLKD